MPEQKIQKIQHFGALSRSDRSVGVLVVDDMAMRRASLAGLVSNWARDRQLGVATVGVGGLTGALERCATLRAVLLNVGATSVCSQEVVGALRLAATAVPRAALVVLSDRTDPAETIASFRLGCQGFIPTTLELSTALQALAFILAGGTYFPPSTLEAIIERQSGQGASEVPSLELRDTEGGATSDLTGRQRDVLAYLGRGEPNKVIARRLGVTEATVKLHVRQIMRKFGASNRTQIAVISRSGTTRSG